MRQLKTIAIALLSISLVACASGPRPYESSKSMALNLAEVGGIDGLKDQKVTVEEYEQISSSNVLLDAGWTAAITANPAPGFSSGFGLGLGLLTMLFPKPVGAQQHQFVAWMPAEMAENPADAQIKMRDMTATAFEAALKELGSEYGPMEYWVNPMLWGRKDQMASLFIYPPGTGCLPADAQGKRCTLLAEIVKPTLIKNSPAVLGYPSRPSYFFAADIIKNSFVFPSNGDNGVINTPRLYALISKHLPDWAYFYTPPAKYLRTTASDKDPQIPLIYYRGKPEMFVMPTRGT